MSFCRITGRSRNLPKPHYFPLIPPMSPADAQRICRITGKAHGLPMHHYVPVLLRKTQALAKCRITKVADVYGKRKHYPLPGFKYLRPIIDLKQTKQLVNIISKKSDQEIVGEFVYPVKERKYSLMFPAQLELAVRSGDIKDVMLAEDSDQVLLKMKIGEDISLRVKEVKQEEYMNSEELYEGEGVAAEEDVVTEKIEEKKVEEIVKEKKQETAVMISSEDWRDLIQPLLDGCDWDQFQEEAAKGMSTAKWSPPALENGRISNDFQKNQKILTPIQIIQNSLSELTTADLDLTRNIFQKLIDGGKHVLDKLPFINEIQQVVTKLATGKLSELVQIPGLNLCSTTDKTRFIIGQMIETKKGKIFVPGQTVNGDNFLPGFVVNTNDGPALIPGLVVSKQKHSSIFLPGENILIDRETGRYEFVAEQKLILCKDLELKVKPEPDELNMFIEQSVVDCVVNKDIAKMVAVKYDFQENDLENLSKLVLIITHFAKNLPKSTLLDESNQRVNDKVNGDILKNALLTAVGLSQDYPNHETIYNSLIEIFANLENRSNVITELCNYLNNEKCQLIFNEIIEENNHKLPNVSKIDILKSALRPNAANIIEKLSTVIEEDLLAPAFQNVSHENTEFVEKVLTRVKTQVNEILTEEKAYEVLQIAIVDAIKEISETKLSNFLANETNQAITDLLQEAIGLAVALGMNETADSLLKLITDPESIHLIADDPLTLEILKRLTVMRQIADKQPQLHGALLELKRNPHNARTNPKLRELVRESAVLMVPDVPNLKTSEHIPTRLFQEHNTLAMEDFVTRNRQPGTLMIIKRGLQAVVPKEASRAVLNGQVAYTLIDETGIRHFKPMDVFSALRLSKPTVLRFSGYECLGACEQSKQISNADKAKYSRYDRISPRMVSLKET